MKTFAALLLLICTSVCFGEEIKGIVLDVHDGDTVTVEEREGKIHKIRLDGIDAPELAQPYGREAAATLSTKILDKEVEVVVSTTDKYGRTVGEIFYHGQSMNLRQVTLGSAWHYKQYSKSIHLSKAEAYSRIVKRGLWKEENPTPPWDFRRKKKTNAEDPNEVQETE